MTTEEISKIILDSFQKGIEKGVHEGVRIVRRIVAEGYSANSPMVEAIIEQAMIDLKKEGELLIESVKKETEK